jgi:RND family efflux transporter MFP subunit
MCDPCGGWTQARIGLFFPMFLVLGPVLVSGCRQAVQAERREANPAVQVEVATPVVRRVTDFAEFTGQTVATDSVEIRARVTGFVDKVHFDQTPAQGVQGEVIAPAPRDVTREVQQGELLYEIDKREYEASLAAAQAEVAAAEAAQKKAEGDFNRQKALKDRGAASAEEFDRAVAAKSEADAQFLSAKSHEKQALLNLEFTRITAPIRGRISRSRVTAGNLVSADSTLLTTIVSVDPIYGEFDLDERTLLNLMQRIREGELSDTLERYPVALALANENDFPHEGVLSFVDNQVDPGTGTIRMRAVFANPKTLDDRGRVLIPGLFARIRVPVSEPYDGVLINERAVGRDQGQTYVYLVDAQNEVVYRAIELGLPQGSLRAVKSGLKGGERVVVNGLQRIRPGVRVEPREVTMEPPSVGSESAGQAAKPAPSPAPQ